MDSLYYDRQQELSNDRVEEQIIKQEIQEYVDDPTDSTLYESDEPYDPSDPPVEVTSRRVERNIVELVLDFYEKTRDATSYEIIDLIHCMEGGEGVSKARVLMKYLKRNPQTSPLDLISLLQTLDEKITEISPSKVKVDVIQCNSSHPVTSSDLLSTIRPQGNSAAVVAKVDSYLGGGNSSLRTKEKPSSSNKCKGSSAAADEFLQRRGLTEKKKRKQSDSRLMREYLKNHSHVTPAELVVLIEQRQDTDPDTKRVRHIEIITNFIKETKHVKCSEIIYLMESLEGPDENRNKKRCNYSSSRSKTTTDGRSNVSSSRTDDNKRSSDGKLPTKRGKHHTLSSDESSKIKMKKSDKEKETLFDVTSSSATDINQPQSVSTPSKTNLPINQPQSELSSSILPQSSFPIVPPIAHFIPPFIPPRFVPPPPTCFLPIPPPVPILFNQQSCNTSLTLPRFVSCINR